MKKVNNLSRISFAKSADKMHYFWRACEFLYIGVIAMFCEAINNDFSKESLCSLFRLIFFIIILYFIYKSYRLRPVITFNSQNIVIKNHTYQYSDIDCFSIEHGCGGFFLTILYPILDIFGKKSSKIEVAKSPGGFNHAPAAVIKSPKILYIQLKKGTTFKFRIRSGYCFDLENDFSEEDAEHLQKELSNRNLRQGNPNIRGIDDDVWVDRYFRIGYFFIVGILIMCLSDIIVSYIFL